MACECFGTWKGNLPTANRKIGRAGHEGQEIALLLSREAAHHLKQLLHRRALNIVPMVGLACIAQLCGMQHILQSEQRNYELEPATDHGWNGWPQSTWPISAAEKM